MKIREFLDHHGIAENPFADEDAQTDLIFKGHCITSTYHPTWDKIFGNPGEPATAIVFGEKGAGKTALRLQMVRHLADYNADHPGARVFVVQYDDFNPYLDRFRERFSGRRRRADRVLGQWELWDHMDAILSSGVTQLADRILEVKTASHPAACDTEPLPIKNLNPAQVRDVLLLAACYDQSTAETSESRWHRLRRKLGFRVWRTKWDMALGIGATLAVFGLILGLGIPGLISWSWWLRTPWPYLVIAAGWAPRLWRLLKWHWRARAIARSTRVLNQNVSLLRRILLSIPGRQIVGQPLPAYRRTDDRYQLLTKFQDVLHTLGFTGIIVLVDRVDEPYLINGSSELMRAMIWPMLDNKFLKHPGLGLKLLVPVELSYYIDREDREFHQRARLDKQNLVRSLDWTGQSLYDLAESRLQACAVNGRTPRLTDLFEPAVDQQRLVNALRTLRVPRHLFKFLYRLFVTHTNAHTDDNPAWQISGETFEAVLALYQREQDAFDRGTTV
jgi:hypothetical protein